MATSTKLYLLLDIVNSNSKQAVQALTGRPGITSIDVLEGPPDLMVVIEGRTRQRAANNMMDILNSIDNITENFTMLPVSNGKRF
jgi:hypothetical protein